MCRSSSWLTDSCNSIASSRGRGTRAAGWFNDYITSQGDSDMASLVLADGIKGWANGGVDYVQWMEGYDEKIWSRN